MKQAQLLEFLVLLFVLGITFPVEWLVQNAELPASGNTADGAEVFDVLAIKTEAELRIALSDPEITEIALANDIITLDDLIINRDNNVSLNLNGCKIASLRENARVLDVQAGSLSLLGQGSIVATGMSSTALRIKGAMTAENSNYARTMIAAGVTLYAPNYYGLLISSNFNSAYGVTIDLYGSVIAHDGICINNHVQGQGDNAPKINIADEAKIIVDENEGTVLCAFGYGNWRIGAADLTGATGAVVKSGKLAFQNTKVIATGDAESGAVIQLEDHPNRNIHLAVDGGEYLSVQSYIFAETNQLEQGTSLRTFVIQNGTFSGQLGIFSGVVPKGGELSVASVFGGKFNFDVSNYLAPTHHVERNRAKGEFFVIDEAKPEDVIDKAARLKTARQELSDLIQVASRYTAESYAGNELGELQVTVNKALATVKRAVKTAEKLLQSEETSLTKTRNTIERLDDCLDEVRSIENAMRSELSEEIRWAKDNHAKYTSESYLDLALAAADGEQLLAQDELTLVNLQDALGVMDAAKIMLEECDPDLEAELGGTAVSWEELLALRASTLVAEESIETTNETTDETIDETVAEAPAESAETPELSEVVEAENIEENTEAEEVEEFEKVSIPRENTADIVVDEEDDFVFVNEVMDDEPIALPPEPEIPSVDPALETAKADLRNFLNAISALDPGEYTPESYSILARTANMAGGLLQERAEGASSTVLLSALSSVNIAYEKLVKKSQNPANAALEEAEQNLRTILDAVQDLTVNDYELESAEQFGELQVIIAKTKSVLTKGVLTLPEIMEIMDQIKASTSGLKGLESENDPASESTIPEPAIAQPTPTVASVAVEASAPIPAPVAKPTAEQSTSEPSQNVSIDWTAFREVINDISALNSTDYTTTSYNALLGQLGNAKILVANANVTQAEIDEAVFELNLAILALERVSSPRLSTTQDFSTPINQPVASTNSSDLITQSSDTAVTPNWLMSMMAGAYAGLATYRRSRLEAKKRKAAYRS